MCARGTLYLLQRNKFLASLSFFRFSSVFILCLSFSSIALNHIRSVSNFPARALAQKASLLSSIVWTDDFPFDVVLHSLQKNKSLATLRSVPLVGFRCGFGLDAIGPSAVQVTVAKTLATLRSVVKDRL